MLAATAAMLLALGCATAGDPPSATGATRTVDEVELIGVEHFEKDELLEYLHLAESKSWPVGEDVYFNPAYLPVDGRRIVELYRSCGYLDARVLRFEVVERDEDEVDLLIEVREGEPVRIVSVEIVWPEGRPSGPDGPLPVAEIEEEVGLREGLLLEVEALEEAAVDLELAVESRGFPRARAEARAEVDRSELSAKVIYTVVPGGYATIGDLSFTGLELVPEGLVRREVDYAGGRPYSPALVERIEKSIYAMDVFRSVAAATAGEVDDDGEIDLVVHVVESEPQAIKVGAGFGFEPARWEERLTARYTHKSLFGELTRLDLGLKVGYAELPTPFNVVEHGPVVTFEPRLRKKGWLEKRLVWTFAPRFELGIEEGYRFYTPGARVGVSRFFFQRLEISVSHNSRFVDFFAVSPVIDASSTMLGLDFRDPYVLTYFEIETSLFLTDRVLDPRNGVVLQATYDIAGRLPVGDYDFHKITPRLKAYWQVHPRLQLALQALAGMIFPYGPQAGAPFDLKYYLGGANTVRGWGLRHLAPRTSLCPSGENCRRIPIGGDTMVQGNLELRLRTWRDLYVVAFADGGDVRPGRLEFSPGDWNYSSGGGLRYDSPIGMLRVDCGVRLNETELSEGEPRWALHIGLGEAF